MKRLNELTERVEMILENDPKTRNSDHILYKEYLRIYHNDLLFLPVCEFLIMVSNKSNGIASIESVGRCRRKIVERRSDLAGDPNVETQRELNEEAFRAYARS